MTASQPPQPPTGGQQPGPGTPPSYGQPAPPPPGFPAPGHPQPIGHQPPGSTQSPGGGASPFGQSAGSGFSMDLKKLRMADYVIAAGTVLYLVLGVLPWVSFNVGSVLGVNIPGVDISGFSFSGMVTFSFVLFLLATAWAILPAFYALEVSFPRSFVTVGLAALGLVLTLFAWIRSLSYDFKIVPLLALLTAAAIAVFAVFTLLPELRGGPALPGGLAKAGQWANQSAPAFGQHGGSAAPQAGPPAGAPPQQYSPPPQQYAPPPTPPAPSGGPSTPDAGATPGAGPV